MQGEQKQTFGLEIFSNKLLLMWLLIGTPLGLTFQIGFACVSANRHM